VSGLLGLGLRGRMVVVGVLSVRLAAAKGRLRLAIVAADASVHSREKVTGLLRAKRIPTIEGVSAAALGAAVHRERTAAVGVVDAQLARGIAAHSAPRTVQDDGRTG